MATNSEEIVVKFRTEGGQEVEETFRKAADAGDKFHQKITKAGSALGDLRLKSESRVANNIGAITQAMIGGANAGDVLAISISKVTESFRGSLLFAGAATTGAALYSGIVRIGESIINLHTEMHNLRTESLIPGDFLGADRVNKDLDITIGRITQLQGIQKQASFFSGIGSGIAGALPFGIGSILQQVGAIAGLISKFSGGEIESERKNARGEFGQVAEIQTSINAALRESLTGNEELAVLYKIQADSKKEAFSIAERAAKAGVSDSQETKEALDANRNQEDYLSALNAKKFALQRKEFGIQENIVDIQKQQLAPAEENLSILDARISGIENLLDTEHELTDQEREQYRIQLGQLEATKQRAAFARQLQKDLAGLELNRVRGGVGSNRARIESAQTRAQAAAAYGTDSPEFQSAEAGLEEEQFNQFQQYEKDPGAFRQKRINEEFQRKRFDYLRNTGQLPSDIATSPIQERENKTAKGIQDLIETLKRLPAAVGVG